MKLQLVSGAYQAKSIIASAQRCVNLYPEINQQENTQAIPSLPQSAAVTTHYPTAGLTLLSTASDAPWRGIYVAGNGNCYGVAGGTVYLISSTFALTPLGSIGYNTTPVSMSDNGIVLVLVDGTTNGYTINLANNTFSLLNDSTGSFVGADFVDYIDTFFVFNKSGTQAFYCSLSNSITFDPTYIANKTGRSDTLVGIIVCRREIWLIGSLTTEIWYDAGNGAFPFAIVNGAFIEHGCVAKNSIARQDTAIYWLSKDNQGQAIILEGVNYTAKRVSTHAIENEIQKYSVISDAVAHIHQLEGHTFYVLSFPTANKTWVYDIATQLWHERNYTDSNGQSNRVRVQTGVNFNGKFIVGDWQNGNLYYYDVNNFTDNGQPIIRTRSFPHIVNELNRIMYSSFIADMQTGATSDPTQIPQLSLRWSDDRGYSWGNPITQDFGASGKANELLNYQRLGMARDRVFELSWSSPVPTALNGAYIDVVAAAT